MALYDLKTLLSENSYPGRGIVIGKSADGKSAKLVIEGNGNLTLSLAGINAKNLNNIVGSFTWRQEITFDLTKNPPTIASLHIGQSIEA